MTAGPDQSEGLRLLQQALAHYRDRNSAGELPAGELPQGMEFLLRVANADSEQLGLASQVTGVDHGMLQKAALRYVEHLLLQPGADPYRTLGVNPWTPAAEVRTHYRLLIRLFHPDRTAVDAALAADYSARINQAHTALARGTQGAATATAANHGGRDHAPAPRNAPSLRARPRTRQDSAPATRSRLNPQRVLASTALLACVAVGYVYLDNRSARLVSAETAAESPVAATSPLADAPDGFHASIDHLLENLPAGADQPPRPDVPPASAVVASGSTPDNSQPVDSVTNKPARPTRTTEEAPAPERTKAVAQATPKQHLAAPSPPHAEATGTAHEQAAKPAAPRAATAAPLPAARHTEPTTQAQPRQPAAQQAEPVLAAVTAPPARPAATAAGDTSTAGAAVPPATPATPDPARATAAAPAHAAAPLPPADAPRPPSDAQMHQLLAQFVASYNQGDLDSLMTIMDDDVATDEPGGKTGLRTAYGRLFRSTVTRSIELSNLRWNARDERAYAQAGYRVMIAKPGEARSRVQTGTLRFEVAEYSGRPLIKAFYHEADKH